MGHRATKGNCGARKQKLQVGFAQGREVLCPVDCILPIARCPVRECSTGGEIRSRNVDALHMTNLDEWSCVKRWFRFPVRKVGATFVRRLSSRTIRIGSLAQYRRRQGCFWRSISPATLFAPSAELRDLRALRASPCPKIVVDFLTCTARIVNTSTLMHRRISQSDDAAIILRTLSPMRSEFRFPAS